ncbi:MAG: energy transducer TonB [Bacteroidales bacterium]|nr:energy transducer TonB [Bacteroidales bacterium]
MKKTIFLKSLLTIAAMLLSYSTIQAQVTIEDTVVVNEVEEEIFVFVEDFPEFPNGEENMYKYLGSNIKYPKDALENGIQGTVVVKFVVEKDGTISNVKAIRKIGGGCDEEAVRVVKRMPRWKPGKQRGKPVRTEFTLPIQFKLR